MNDVLTVDAFLEAEMLYEDHMDIMIDDVETNMIHLDELIDDSIKNNLFYDEEDILAREDDE